MSIKKLSITFAICVFHSPSAYAETSDILSLCKTKEGVQNIIQNDGFQIKPDKFQIAALRNAGMKPLEDYDMEVRERCSQLLGNPTSADVSYSQTFSPITFQFNPNPTAKLRVTEFPDFRCSASWDESDCIKSRTFQVPSGQQACGIGWGWRGSNDFEYPVIGPTLFYTNDPENPDRFRGYSVKLEARGSQNILDPKKGKITFHDIKLYSISSDFNNEVRYATGCELPAQNSEPTGGITIPEIPELPGIPETKKNQTTPSTGLRK